MFELYSRTNADNTMRTTLECDIHNKNNNYIIEFKQHEFSDNNKWGMEKIRTDLIVTRYILPEIFTHISSNIKLKKYIIDNFDESLELMDKLENMSSSMQRIRISLPTATYLHRRGFITDHRTIKDTPFPLIVELDGKDVSSAFIDFGDFEQNAVINAYEALVNGNMPHSKNDIFYTDGIKSLHEELINSEMSN